MKKKKKSIWIRKPSKPKPDAEKFKPKLHEILPPFVNITDEDIERLCDDDNEVYD